MSCITQRLAAPERRAQLLDCTKAIVAEQGFHAVSIEAVARRAGITRPIVYHHFDGGLDDLLVALVERETARALEQMAALVTGEGLLASFEAYLAAVEADPVTWRLVLMPPEGLPAVLRTQTQTWRQTFAAAITLPSSPDPELTGRLLQALADEGARALLDGFDRDRLVAQAAWVIGALDT